MTSYTHTLEIDAEGLPHIEGEWCCDDTSNGLHLPLIQNLETTRAKTQALVNFLKAANEFHRHCGAIKRIEICDKTFIPPP